MIGKIVEEGGVLRINSFFKSYIDQNIQLVAFQKNSRKTDAKFCRFGC